MEAASNKIVHRDEITDDAFTDSANIADKYIRTDEVSAGAVVGEDEAYYLPVIDMAKLLDPELSASETAKLGSACRDWGFFQVITVTSANQPRRVFKCSGVRAASLQLRQLI
jgi:hypothetical protein